MFKETFTTESMGQIPDTKILKHLLADLDILGSKPLNKDFVRGF